MEQVTKVFLDNVGKLPTYWLKSYSFAKCIYLKRFIKSAVHFVNAVFIRLNGLILNSTLFVLYLYLKMQVTFTRQIIAPQPQSKKIFGHFYTIQSFIHFHRSLPSIPSQNGSKCNLYINSYGKIDVDITNFMQILTHICDASCRRNNI